MSGLRRMHYQNLVRLKNNDLRRHQQRLLSFRVWSSSNPAASAMRKHQRRSFLQYSHNHNAENRCGGCSTTTTFSDRTTANSPLHALPFPFSSSSSSSSFGGYYNNNSMVQRCCFSTTTTSNNDNNNNNMGMAAVTRISQNKLVLGSHKWASMDASHYCEIVHTALLNGITTIEAGQGTGALQALHQCLQSQSLSELQDDAITTRQQRPATIRILQRVGYRTTLRLPPPPPTPPPPMDDKEDHDELHDAEKQQPSTTSPIEADKQPEEAAAETTFALLPGDVIVEEVPVSAEDGSSAAVKPVPGAPPPRSKQSTSTCNSIPPAGSTTVVLHNISAAGIQEAMSTSPFITKPLTLNQQNKVLVETVLMLHNPEVQGGAISQDDGGGTKWSGLILPSTSSLTSSKTRSTTTSPRQEAICAQLVESFVALERAVVQSSGHIASYGIVSNGLGLPDNHPLHLSWHGSIRPALERTFQILNTNNDNDSEGNKAAPRRQLLHFNILELPVNLIETTGLQVARQVQQDLQQDDEFRNMFANNNNSSSNSKSPIEIFAMRPLSAYPDLGTGQDGHSLVLADYLLPTLATSTSTSTSSNEMAAGEGATKSATPTTTTPSDSDSKPQAPPPRMQWSHTMSSPPDIYNVALQSAMAHFDAEAILEAQQERLAQGEKADLTAEERETLDGCKLMQSLLHDVDVGLEKMRCFAVHKRELTQRIIPLIYDTFEEYDDDTAKVLQTFFAAYSLAVRYAIAKNTRQLLLHGEKLSLAASSNASNIPIFKDLHPDMKLQEYAIGFILKQQIETLPKRQETNNESNVDVAAASGDGAGKTAQSEALRSKDVIDKIVVGCADPDQVIDDLELVYQFYARKIQKEKQAAKEAEIKEEGKE